MFIKSEDVESGAFYMPPAAQQEVRLASKRIVLLLSGTADKVVLFGYLFVAVVQVNCGKSLVVARASNKGTVGFAFRYYDTSFAFVTCHLSSDSKVSTDRCLR